MTKAKALTEEEWLSYQESWRLMRHLQQHCLIGRARGGRRRQRLLACASCRRAWHLFDDRERAMIEVAERVADGLASRTQLAEAEREANEILRKRQESMQPRAHPMGLAAAAEARARLMLAFALQLMTSNWFSDMASNAAGSVGSALASWEQSQGRPFDQAGASNEQRRHADLVRDVFRNPFRPAAPFDQTALAPRGSTAERVARSIYDEGRWDELPVLADALEDAGCVDADLLDHCRATTPHARGCWAVDLVLGIP